MQSPIGLVLKGENQTRLIFHLSYDFNKQSGLGSLNANTPKEKCHVKYNDLDHAMEASFLWKGTDGRIFYSKSDVKSAFHLVPLRKGLWQWLILKAEHPVTVVTYYFVDKCLPFGASISCSHFQRFSNSIKHVVEFKARRPKSTTNYIDDFLFAAATARLCNQLTRVFLEVCSQIGVPVADEKTEWATQLIQFPGVLLDGYHFKLYIPEEKRIRACNALKKMMSCRKTTVKEIQQLTGLLNFLSRVIYLGREFTRQSSQSDEWGIEELSSCKSRYRVQT